MKTLPRSRHRTQYQARADRLVDAWAISYGTAPGTISVKPGPNGETWAEYWDTTSLSFCPIIYRMIYAPHVHHASHASHMFTWTLPDGVANDEAQREFTFVFEVAGGNSIELHAYIISQDLDLTLETVQFIDDLEMVADPGLPEWNRAGVMDKWYDWVNGDDSKTHAIAYANGDNHITVNATFSSDTIHSSFAHLVEVRFVSPSFPWNTVYSNWVALTYNNDLGRLEALGVTSLWTLEMIYCGLVADFIEPMELEWEFRFNNGGVQGVDGASTNPFYVTRTEPLGPVYHTVIHVGCVAAKGIAGEQAAFDAIWGKFAGLAINSVRVHNGEVVNNAPLYFYGIVATDTNPAAIHPNPLELSVATQKGVISTEGLLRERDGQCGAWALFFRNVIEAQGIDGASIIRVDPTPTPGAIYFPIPGTAHIGGRLYTNAHDTMLMPENAGWHHGQKPLDRVFGQHFLVQFGDAFYDPSYGKKFDGVASGQARLALTNFIEQYGMSRLLTEVVSVDITDDSGNIVTYEGGIGAFFGFQDADGYTKVFLPSNPDPGGTTIAKNEWLTITTTG
jgi:hypothetical protein